MIVRFGNKNDCKAVWTWINDQRYGPFINANVDVNYEKYQKWFGFMSRKNAIVIGVNENLRVGMAFSTSIQGRTYMKCLIKPAYCGYVGREFIQQTCSLLFSEHQKDIYVELPTNEAATEQHFASGFSEVGDRVVVYRQPM